MMTSWIFTSLIVLKKSDSNVGKASTFLKFVFHLTLPPGPSELLMACLIEQDMRDEDLGILSMMHGANITKSKVPETFHMSTIALFFVEGQTEVCLQSMLLE